MDPTVAFFIGMVLGAVFMAGVDAARRISTTEAPPDPGNVYPCVRITVDDAGKVTAGSLYAPGLPAGEFNIYPVGIEDCSTVLATRAPAPAGSLADPAEAPSSAVRRPAGGDEQ